MIAHTSANRFTVRTAAPRISLAGRISIGSLLLLGLGALAGGIAFASRPDGSVMHFDVSLLAGSPFPDYLVPGLVLGGLFGIGSFAVAALGLRHAAIAPFLAVVIGSAQMIWIVVELLIIKEFSFLHPTMFGIGLAIAASGGAWGWPAFRAWQTRNGTGGKVL